ncbi:MAG: hypothetical protein ABI435_01260 [Pseudolysinimonas sp.]
MTLTPRRLLGTGLAALALMVSGCTSTSPPASSFCVPRFTIEPSVASPGDTITLTSDTTCDVEPPGGGWSVVLAPVGQLELGVRTNVADGFDGSFSITLSVPATFPSGEAFAGIENWDYSTCSDTAGGSCASATATFTVR